MINVTVSPEGFPFLCHLCRQTIRLLPSYVVLNSGSQLYTYIEGCRFFINQTRTYTLDSYICQ